MDAKVWMGVFVGTLLNNNHGMKGWICGSFERKKRGGRFTEGYSGDYYLINCPPMGFIHYFVAPLKDSSWGEEYKVKQDWFLD